EGARHGPEEPEGDGQLLIRLPADSRDESPARAQLPPGFLLCSDASALLGHRHDGELDPTVLRPSLRGVVGGDRMVLAVADHYQARTTHPAAGQVRRHRLGAA